MRLVNFYNPSAKICSNGNLIKSVRNLKKLNVRHSQCLGIIFPGLIEIGVNIPYARHYKLRFVYFYTHFLKIKNIISRRFFHKILPLCTGGPRLVQILGPWKNGTSGIRTIGHYMAHFP